MDRYLFKLKISEKKYSKLYYVEDSVKKRHVAIKAINPESIKTIGNKNMLPTILAEITKLEHRNLIKVYETVVDQGWVYCAMEYMDGGNLRQKVCSGMSIETILGTIKKIINALVYIQQFGYIHYGLKPENILFDSNGRIVLADLCVSKFIHKSPDKYMSPEMLNGKEIDCRSDLYSLGMILRDMLKHNNGKKNEELNVNAHKFKETKKNKDIYHKKLNKIARKLLSFNPEERFKDARDLLSAIEKIEEEVSNKKWQLLKKKNFIISYCFLGLTILIVTILISWKEEDVESSKKNIKYDKAGQNINDKYEKKITQNDKLLNLIKKIKYDKSYRNVHNEKRKLIETLRAENNSENIRNVSSNNFVEDMGGEKNDYKPSGIIGDIEEKDKIQYQNEGTDIITGKAVATSIEIDNDTNNLKENDENLKYKDVDQAEKENIIDTYMINKNWDLAINNSKKNNDSSNTSANKRDSNMKIGMEDRKAGNKEINKRIPINQESDVVQNRKKNNNLLKNKNRGFENFLGMKFVYIKPGKFAMGSPESEKRRDYDEQMHEVTLTKGFWIQTTEVTVGSWRAFAESNEYLLNDNKNETTNLTDVDQIEKRAGWKDPGFFQTDSHPVVCVSWNEIQLFIKWMRLKDGIRYRLPTESEWEYSARSGTTGYSYWVDEKVSVCNYANVADIRARTHYHNWIIQNCDDKWVYTSPVGSYLPNQWGLYDMIGNVWEWCQDWYGAYPNSSVSDPQGPDHGDLRIVRGGSWSSREKGCRSAFRFKGNPDDHFNYIGFRLVINS